MARITTNVCEFQPRRIAELPLQTIVRDVRFLNCYCETLDPRIITKDPDCEGTWLKKWCYRALQYTRIGGAGTLSNRKAFGDLSDDSLLCELNLDTEIEWFFEPSEEDVTDWLTSMDVPPPTEGIYKITLFFECFRGMVWEEGIGGVPCGDETSSQIELFGICYGSGVLP